MELAHMGELSEGSPSAISTNNFQKIYFQKHENNFNFLQVCKLVGKL